ncbi:amidohydrolase family protein [Ihubacter sp. mB4P-1]|uniref:metal-dependent hydrolase family protein n=1 Tax=Ihubacter sp. mB4P-1 TaxID=3242370 RepID=UPI003C7B62A3
MIVIKNCRLIPELTEGFDEAKADLVIDGKYICEILPARTASYESAEVIDAQGMTLLPGFFDLHAHLMFKDQDYNASMMRGQNEYLLDCMEHAGVYLKHGYTTIRDCGNDFYTGIATKNAVNRGIVKGPHIITAGKCISPVAKGNESFGSLYLETDSPYDMLHIVRTETAKGVDFIKYMVTGAVLNEGGVPGELITTEEEIRAITSAAEKLGTYVAAHCHGTEGIKIAVKNGIRTIEHASYVDDECVELMLKRKDLIATVPTLSIAYTIYKELYEGGIMPEFVEKCKAVCASMAKSAAMCEAAGVLVGWGTDLDMQMFERFPGLEFAARNEMGQPNLQILKEATINSARIICEDHLRGTVKKGKYADLVLIDGNPDENMAVMKQLPKYVFREGSLAASN